MPNSSPKEKTARFEMRLTPKQKADLETLAQKAGEVYHYWGDRPTKTDLVIYALCKTFPDVMGLPENTLAPVWKSDELIKAIRKAYRQLKKQLAGSTDK